MVRITKIEIKNFRAFQGAYQIDLAKAGKNLLIYGENGSGKSSLYLALKSFLESSDGTHRFEYHQNIFSSDEGHIRLHFSANSKLDKETYEWSEAVPDDAKVQPIIDASKAKGFFDYKELLKTNYLHHENNTVNVFDLLIKNLLANVINDGTGLSVTEDWENIVEVLPSLQNGIQQAATLEEQLEVFNRELTNRLDELQKRASEILDKLGYKDSIVGINFDFQGITYNSSDNTLDNQQILLTVKFFERNLLTHHRFLNEGKLSAIALAVCFAALLLQPVSDMKILVLDDVLIGLDMSNRLPLFRILKDYFSDYQIFLMTYDKAWYEIVKQQTEKEEWEYAEFGLSPIDEYEMPVYMKNKANLDKAKEYLNANDYKACAIYLRTIFEMILREYCDKKDLLVRYSEDPKELKTEDFWTRIKAEKKRDVTFPDHEICLLDLTLVDEIQLYRRIILNPLSHATIENIQRREVESAVKAVERLKSELNRHLNAST